VPAEREIAGPAEEENHGELVANARKKIQAAAGRAKPATEWPKGRGKLILDEADNARLRLALNETRRADRLALPALLRGNSTATEYDSKAANFSTQTRIAELPDGKKVFIVHNYKSTGIHRWMDSAMKHLTGYPMRKATREQWKTRFEEKSNLPTIEIDDPEIVAMPFVPNINLGDLFSRQKEIKNFGECEFAEKMEEADFFEVLGEISVKVNEIHGRGEGWGELILPNVIIDNDREVHICDPEVAYDQGVAPVDQKAYDLLDLITSSCTSMEKSMGTGHERVVASILNRYADDKVFESLKIFASKKAGLKEKIFFGYSKARLGLESLEQFNKIKKAIIDYLT
jgi:hypothetical protein